MPNENLENDHGKDRPSNSDAGSKHGWKSKWVESSPPAADDIKPGFRVNPPQPDDVPGDGGADTTDS